MDWKFKRFFSRDKGTSHPDAGIYFDRGSGYVSRQQWQLALECFREAARLNPGHAEAHANMGNVLRQLLELDAAMAAYDRALAVKPDYAEVYYNRGTLLAQTNQLRPALESLDSALTADASMVRAHSRRGDVLWRMGELEAAEKSYLQAIAILPDDAAAHCNVGVLRNNAGDHVEALKRFDAALACEPRLAGAHAGRGLALMALRRPSEALQSFEMTIELNPGLARAFSNRAQAQADLGLLSEASASHEQAALLDPQDAGIHFNHGAYLSDRKDWSAAIESYGCAIRLRPDYAEAHCNLALAHQEMGNGELALASYARALEHDPRLATAYNNRGNLFRVRKKFLEASRDYREALALVADSAEAHYNLGQLALIQGDLAAGWPEYEWRAHIDEAKAVSHVRRPELVWSGESSLRGKRIVLYAEQGLGDTIQFCRYASLVASLGAYVILEVQPVLGDLLAKLEGVSELVFPGSSVQRGDFQCSLLSLPGAFKTTLETIPCKIPYLYAEPSRVEQHRQIQAASVRPRVGLAWSGNPHHSNDRNRSVALGQLIAYLPSEFDYYCLQNEIRGADSDVLRSRRDVTINATTLKSFQDTAALLDTLDLVVSVDTSVAHLSGAMGKKTWLLLPYYPDWRWMLDRSDSPWYPSMTLYRQPTANDWNSVMSKIKKDLLDLLVDMRVTE